MYWKTHSGQQTLHRLGHLGVILTVSNSSTGGHLGVGSTLFNPPYAPWGVGGSYYWPHFQKVQLILKEAKAPVHIGSHSLVVRGYHVLYQGFHGEITFSLFSKLKKKTETPRSWNLHLLPPTILLLLPRTQHGGGAAEIQRRASCITRLFSSKGCEHPLSPFTNLGNKRWELGKDVLKKKVFSQGISQYNYIVRTPN